MQDPVRVSGGGKGRIYDRSSAQQLLLNGGVDPFTRIPITESDFNAAPDILARINEWKDERRREAAAGAPAK